MEFIHATIYFNAKIYFTELLYIYSLKNKSFKKKKINNLLTGLKTCFFN